jgi:hypothetical protein
MRPAGERPVVADARSLVIDAEQAARAGDLDKARRLYLVAGDRAATGGNPSAAARCFRHAVELDLFDVVAVQRLAATVSRAVVRAEWSSYAAALRGGTMPAFASTAIQLVVSNAGAEVVAAPVGTVLEVLLTGDDLVEAHPAPRFDAMPLAMALLIIHRALWPAPRTRPVAPMVVRVAYRGRQPVRLDESGDWDLGAS